MTAPTPYTTSEISIFDASSSSSNPYINILLLGNKWGGPIGSAATVYYSFPASRNDAYWSQDPINGYDFDETSDGTPDYLSLTPLTSSQQNGITLALNAWANVANLDFIKVNETPTAVGDIRVGFTSGGSMSPELYAYTYTVDPYWYDYSDIIPYTRSGDIWFNKNQPDQPGNNFATGAMGYFAGLHEIGHALGLDHSFAEEEGDIGLPTNIDYIQYTVMSYSDRPGLNFDGLNEYYPTTPMLYDILAIQHLYGANNDYNVNDNVYVFSSSQRYYQTIWDAGGNDTIKYASSTGGIINLEAGSFSQLGKTFKVGFNNAVVQQDNIAIAFNVVIENATGGSGNDRITGNSANNILDGGAGADTMTGGDGNDTYIVDNVADSVIEALNEGTDLIKASVSFKLADNVENLTLTGTAAINGTGNTLDNIITGNAGNNTLDGKGGIDTLSGDKGNDTYIVDDEDVTVIERANEGIDLVRASITYTLDATNVANVENLTLTGTNAINGSGNALANTITGNAGNNILDGGAGVDKLIGGNGDDTYIIDLVRTGTTAANYKVALQDTITETSVADSGIDTVQLRTAYTGILNASTITLGANLENLDASLTADTNLNLTGNALANTLIGNDANNILDGGAGLDILIGGKGNDTYLLDLKLQGSGAGATVTIEDSVRELNDTTDGIDTIKLRGAVTLTGNTTLSLYGQSGEWINVENIDASATGLTKLDLEGNARDNTLIGNAAANTLVGGAGNDTLDGGAGADIMIGGGGNDIYIFDNIGDSIGYIGTVSDGFDEIISSASIFFAPLIPAAETIEKITLTGTANLNVNIKNAEFVSSIYGNAGNNILEGSYLGGDQLFGGKGNDTYIIGMHDAVYEQLTAAQGGGIDLVKANTDFTLGANIENLTLTDGTLNGGTFPRNGTGNELNNIITGNAGDNILDGSTGTDSLTGGLGNDTYLVDLKLSGTGANVTGAMEDSIKELANQGTDTVVLRGGSGITKTSTIVLGANLENLDASETGAALLNLTGNALINQLTGNNVANVLDGGAGADTLKGGAGDDIYLVDLIKLDNTTAGLQDTITEESNAGNDTIKLRGSVVLTANATLILDSNLENMDASLTGRSRLNLIGNGQSNVLTGNAAANLLDGASGNDTLFGGTGNDTLLGGMGNDWLDGGAGNDSLDGGDGDDTYIVDNIADAVTEEINGGTDLIKTSITYSLALANNVENLELTGTAAINGTGNADANIITGNAGNNILDGKGGIDTLRGGKGNDTYIVNDEDDVVEEDPNAGIDLIKASSNFTLSNNVENLTLTDGSANGGTNPLEGTGNALENTITGNAGNNILDGGAGVDKLIGGAGDDTYVVDLKVKDRFSGKTFLGSYLALEDTITEAKNAGNDTLVLRGNAPGGYSITLVDNVENLDAQSVIRIPGPSSAGINLYGNALDNRIWGNNDGNSISGGAGNDTLFGGDGEDTLDGGEGINTMAGGKGSDTYIIRNINDVIYELPDDNGVDHIFTFVSINLDLFPGIEYAEVYYGAQNVVISTSAGNIYGGSNGNDQLIGSDGNDTFLSSAGKNTLTGGLGNDTYHVNGTGNTINELSNQGTDLVNASISYSLGNNLENLTLTGTAGINGTGNDLNNVITGNTANNTLSGGIGNDTLSGGIGNDTLIGGGGNDTLTGGIGADVFKWVFSDSWYTNSTDTITDFSTMQGDALDLRDFLLGETQSNLQDYLDIVAQDGNTEITISYNGQLNNVSDENAHIVLTNTDLYALTGQSTQSELIGYLINHQALIIS